MSSNRKKAYLALGINTLIWGAALPIVKLALSFTTPYRYLFYRYLIAAPLATPILIYYLIKFRPKIKQLFTIVFLELIGTTLVLGILYEGLKRTTAVNASLITATAPVFVIIGGIIYLKEKEEKKEWIGLTLALIGTLIITIEPLLKGILSTGGSLYGNGLIFTQNIIWAIYLIVIKRKYKKIPKPFITSISFWVGLITFGIISYFFSSQQPLFADLFNRYVLFASLYMGILGSIIGLTLYLYGHNKIEASEAVLFTYLHPTIAIPLSIVILNDSLSPLSILGIVIIVAGIYLAEIRARRV